MVITRDEIVAHVERCRPWIEQALEHANGTHEYEDILAAILAGHMQLWPNKNGCLVTEIIQHPRKTTLNVFLGGGKMKDLLEMYEPIEQWARAQGCDDLTIHGRKGWERIFRQRGWKLQHVTLGKEL